MRSDNIGKIQLLAELCPQTKPGPTRRFPWNFVDRPETHFPVGAINAAIVSLNCPAPLNSNVDAWKKNFLLIEQHDFRSFVL